MAEIVDDAAARCWSSKVTEMVMHIIRLLMPVNSNSAVSSKALGNVVDDGRVNDAGLRENTEQAAVFVDDAAGR